MTPHWCQLCPAFPFSSHSLCPEPLPPERAAFPGEKGLGINLLLVWNNFPPPRLCPSTLKDVTGPVLCPLHTAPSPGGQPQLPHDFDTSFVSTDPSAVSLAFIVHPQDRNSVVWGTKEPWHQDYPKSGQSPVPVFTACNTWGPHFCSLRAGSSEKTLEHTLSPFELLCCSAAGLKILFLRNCVLGPEISHWISITSPSTEMSQRWKPFQS